MTNSENLSCDRRRHWLDIAGQALRRWRLASMKTRLLGYGSNIVFRVTTADADYVLRLHPPGKAEEARLRSELQWLAAIRRDTQLMAPCPPALTVDEPFIALRHDGLPPPSFYYAVLFEHIAGEVKSARELNARDLYRIGAYLGALHTDAQFDPPPDFDRPRLDWRGLFGEASAYASPAERMLANTEQRAILDDVARRLREPLLALASRPETTGLIHADLLAKNIIFRRDSIAALDFEFCGWGCFLYDLAPLLWQLKGERASDYIELEDALWCGYTSIRCIADAERALLEPLIAARQAASIRWLASNYDNPKVRVVAPSLIAERCAELKRFLESGILRRSTPTL